MIWDGSQVLITWGYRPMTKWAVDFSPTHDGYHASRDRGAAEDEYRAAVVFMGPQDELEALETVLAENRESFFIRCDTGEEIFGADIDYSAPLLVTVEEYGRCDRASYAQYSMPMRLRLLAPAFQGTPSLSPLRLSFWRYGASSKFAVNKRFSYAGAASYLDHRTDPGVFMGEFTQTTAEMRAIRRYLLATARGEAIPFPTLGGVDFPFGNRMAQRRFQMCHVLEWEDLGRENFTDWRLSLVLGQAFPLFEGGTLATETDRGAFYMTNSSGTPDYYVTGD